VQGGLGALQGALEDVAAQRKDDAARMVDAGQLQRALSTKVDVHQVGLRGAATASRTAV
jgi:hypothetical protein